MGCGRGQVTSLPSSLRSRHPLYADCEFGMSNAPRTARRRLRTESAWSSDRGRGPMGGRPAVCPTGAYGIARIGHEASLWLANVVLPAPRCALHSEMQGGRMFSVQVFGGIGDMRIRNACKTPFRNDMTRRSCDWLMSGYLCPHQGRRRYVIACFRNRRNTSGPASRWTGGCGQAPAGSTAVAQVQSGSSESRPAGRRLSAYSLPSRRSFQYELGFVLFRSLQQVSCQP